MRIVKPKTSSAAPPTALFVKMLHSAAADPSFTCLLWNDEGDELFVSDVRAMVDVFLCLTRCSSLGAFLRTMLSFGFERRGLVFRHPLFLRGREDLLPQIQLVVKRRVHKGARVVAAKAPEPPPPMQALSTQVNEMRQSVQSLFTVVRHCVSELQTTVLDLQTCVGLLPEDSDLDEDAHPAAPFGLPQLRGRE